MHARRTSWHIYARTHNLRIKQVLKPSVLLNFFYTYYIWLTSNLSRCTDISFGRTLVLPTNTPLDSAKTFGNLKNRQRLYCKRTLVSIVNHQQCARDNDLFKYLFLKNHESPTAVNYPATFNFYLFFKNQFRQSQLNLHLTAKTRLI